jgi:hypothetical protein
MTYKLTEEDIKIIVDPSKTMDEVKEIFGCHGITIQRWRKKYGWKGKVGSKPGKPKPENMTGSNVVCKNPNCDNEFYLNKRSSVRYCSRECVVSDPGYIKRLSDKLTGIPRPRECHPSTPEFNKYAGKVRRLTEKTYAEHIDTINPDRLPRTLCGVEGGYQLDHIIPIKEGFEKNMSIEDLAKPENLRMLTWKENLYRNWED